MSDDKEEITFFQTHKISMTVLLALGLQAVFFTVWLATMRANLDEAQHTLIAYQQTEIAAHRETKAELKSLNETLNRRIDNLDNSGSRALEVIRSRQNDVISVNTAQEARMHEIDNKISELQRQMTENKFWIEQLLTTMRQYAHPSSIAPQINK